MRASLRPPSQALDLPDHQRAHAGPRASVGHDLDRRGLFNDRMAKPSRASRHLAGTIVALNQDLRRFRQQSFQGRPISGQPALPKAREPQPLRAK